MLNYEFFYNIALHANANWKGGFSAREVAINAYNYLCDFQTSRETGTVTDSIKCLYENLVEDNVDYTLDWAYDIADALNLVDMDYMDYMETDTALIKHILEGK